VPAGGRGSRASGSARAPACQWPDSVSLSRCYGRGSRGRAAARAAAAAVTVTVSGRGGGLAMPATTPGGGFAGGQSRTGPARRRESRSRLESPARASGLLENEEIGFAAVVCICEAALRIRRLPSLAVNKCSFSGEACFCAAASADQTSCEADAILFTSVSSLRGEAASYELSNDAIELRPFKFLE
jgi:hypothetical protein